MRILITGSRDWYSKIIIHQVMLDIEKHNSGPFTLVSGACRTGADIMAENFATRLGWTVERHPADWKTHGKRAGFIRNSEMVDLGADLCIAFILNESRGATMTKYLAEKAGIKTLTWRK